jgi:diguanylate cyclase (GGDEF)-like protein
MIQPSTILLVDKQTKNLHFIQRYLSLQGYLCYTADCQDQAVDIGRNIGPDVVIMNEASLGVESFDIYQILRREPRLDRTQITILAQEQETPTPEAILSRAQGALRVKRTQDALHERISSLDGEGLIDPATGLWNMRQWNLRLSEEYERARRYNGSLSIVVAEIEDLTLMLKNFGEMSGQQIIRHVSALLLARVRNVDFLAYIGDGLFGVLLPHSPLSSATRVADRLQEGVSSLPLPLPEQKKMITLSARFGAAVLLVGDTGPGDMVSRAIRELKTGIRERDTEEDLAAESPQPVLAS